MKRLYGGEFGWSVSWRLGLFAALTLGFPFIIYGLMQATRCAGQGGACGAVALMGSFYLRPIIFIALLLLMIGPPMARMRALGLPGIFGLVVPLLLLADRQFLVLQGAHWSMAFALGVLYLRVPTYLILALVVIAAMALVREPETDGDSLWERHGTFGKATLVAVLVTVAFGLVMLVFPFVALVVGNIGAPPNHVRTGSLRFILFAQQVGTLLAVATAAAVVVYVVLDRFRKPDGPGGRRGEDGPSPRRRTGHAALRPMSNGGGGFGRRSGLPI